VEPKKAKVLLVETNKELRDLELRVVSRDVFHWSMRYTIGRATKEHRSRRSCFLKEPKEESRVSNDSKELESRGDLIARSSADLDIAIWMALQHDISTTR
jgi:hypothetical protein